MKVKPISIDEVQNVKNKELPDEVIEAFNELIVKHWSAYSEHAVIDQCEAVNQILGKFGEIDEVTRDDIFDNNWLDIEPLFQNAGWDVEFDNPGYCETYEPHWIFSKP